MDPDQLSSKIAQTKLGLSYDLLLEKCFNLTCDLSIHILKTTLTILFTQGVTFMFMSYSPGLPMMDMVAFIYSVNN